jgi:hypothetical protein
MLRVGMWGGILPSAGASPDLTEEDASMDVTAFQRELLDSAAQPNREVTVPALTGYYSEDDVMALLGVKRTTLRCWPSQGKGPPRTRAGTRILYDAVAFRHWLAGCAKALSATQPMAA